MNKWDKYESELVDKMQEEAHQAWLEEKDMILEQLYQACAIISKHHRLLYDEAGVLKRIQNAIKFVERCNHE